MKTKMKTTNLNKLNNLLTQNLGINAVLSISDMKKVKGGDGEGDGGVEIIIIPVPKP